MPLYLVRNDITKMHTDAIVNAANSTLLGGGGVDGAIHAAAGRGLLEECRKLGGCRVGEAKITGAYRLPCRYVIHTVGPVWQGGTRGEEALLGSCYRNSLALALEQGCESIAFPLISAGAYGYPPDKALRVATDAITDFLMEQELEVWLVLFDRRSLALGKKRFPGLQELIDEQEVQAKERLFRRRRQDGERAPLHAPSMAEPEFYAERVSFDTGSLEELLQAVDESFQQMLLRKIDQSGMTDAQCYKRANVDRKLFSKIRKDVGYRPKKTTAIAFAVALRLSLEETEELLCKAGYALSPSSRFDIIVRYFIQQGNYDIFQINEALFFYDQTLLGA